MLARRSLGFRYDLPASREDRETIADHASRMLARQDVRAAILVGYGPAAQVTPLVDIVRTKLDSVVMVVREALRVEGGRFWSYLCTDPMCCAAEGSSFDVETNAASAAMVVAGITALPDRAALEGTRRRHCHDLRPLWLQRPVGGGPGAGG